jgi:hypothetical protein
MREEDSVYRCRDRMRCRQSRPIQPPRRRGELMNETIVDVTEVLDRQKITGFNARL